MQLGALLVVLYLALLPVEAPDFDEFQYLWLEHIDRLGPVGAFSEPFGNYTPPYLYLLAAFSLLPLSYLIIIKIVAVLSVVWAALGALRLIRSMGGEANCTAVLFLCAWPSVTFNGPGLGQCDGLWAGFCLMATAAAIERKLLVAATWAGIAFAFKSQAFFIAPFLLGLVIRERAWAALIIPPTVYLAAVTPSWIAGWPMVDLLTIYPRQATLEFGGNAPNLWAVPVAFGYAEPLTIGLVLAGLSAVTITTATAHKGPLPQLALLSTLLLPFFLPKMHERYFFLADLLSFVIAWVIRNRTSFWACGLMQAASVASMVAYMGPMPWLNALASVCTTAAIGLTLRVISAQRSVTQAKCLAQAGNGC